MKLFPPPDAVLTKEELAEALEVSTATIDRADFPCVYLGRLVRYVWWVVVDTLAERSRPLARESERRSPSVRDRMRKVV